MPVLAVVIVCLALVASPAAFAAPPNDDFDAATMIAGLPFADSLDVHGATRALDDPFCGSGVTPTVWYAFKPDATVRVELDATGTTFTPTLCVLTGARGSLVHSSVVRVDPRGRFDALAGVRYSILVAGQVTAGSQLELSVTLAPDQHDDFARAKTITLPFLDALDTLLTSSSPDDPPGCTGTFPSATLWYSLTVAEKTRVALATAGSSYPATVSVFTGARGALTRVTCGFRDAPRPVRFDAKPDVPYRIMVAGEPVIGDLVFYADEGTPGPPNDDADDAVEIAALDFTTVLDASEALREPDDPDCGFHGGSVWYRLTPPKEAQVDLRSDGSNYATALVVARGPRDARVIVACSEGDPLRFSATGGTTYSVMVATRLRTEEPGDRMELAVTTRLRSSLTLSARPRKVVFGRSTALGIGLSAGGDTTNPVVSVYAVARDGSEKLVTTRAVDASGNATVRVRPSRRIKYRVRWPGDGSRYMGSRSRAVDVQVRPIVTTRLFGEAATAGAAKLYHRSSPIGVVGTVRPNKSGRPLIFVAQRLANGRWLAFATGTFRIGRNGTARAFLQPSRPGTYRIRNRIKRDVRHLGAASAWQRVIVR